MLYGEDASGWGDHPHTHSISQYHIILITRRPYSSTTGITLRYDIISLYNELILHTLL